MFQYYEILTKHFFTFPFRPQEESQEHLRRREQLLPHRHRDEGQHRHEERRRRVAVANSREKDDAQVHLRDSASTGDSFLFLF